MNATIQDKKIELIQWLSTLVDESIIEKVAQIRETEETLHWNDLSDAERKSIERGIADADAGRLTPHSEVKKLYERWL